MTLVIKSGLLKLRDDVAGYFASRGVTAGVSLGWRERTKQTNQGAGRANRVVFQPSDDSGDGGEIVSPSQPGDRVINDPSAARPFVGKVRALTDWKRLVIVSVWAWDESAPNDEGAQIAATESLFEWVQRGVQRAAFASARWGKMRWTVDPTERLFGRELLAQLTLQHPIYDEPSETAYPETVAIDRVITS